MTILITWIGALRLRTLPLALAVTGMGNLLAYQNADFQINIALFSILTTLLLQILSNLSNDYGDSIHGADHSSRKGPLRAVQSGNISSKSMLTAIVIFAVFSLVSGLWLLHLSFYSNYLLASPLLVVGLFAIAAAYYYTNGKKPYGYQAMGDISVFIFFGLIGVLGPYHLQTKSLDSTLLLPALSMGFWSTAVLNINNMRDMISDHEAGKETIPIKIGLKKAKYYQMLLVLGGGVFFSLFAVIQSDITLLGFIPGFLLMSKSLIGVWKTDAHEAMDPYLKPQAIGTFLAVLGILFFQWLV